MSVCVQYPSAGCIVEYLEGNAIQIALVTEESGGAPSGTAKPPLSRVIRAKIQLLSPWAPRERERDQL